MATRTPEDDKLSLDPRDPHSLDWHLSEENPAMKWRVKTEDPISEGWLAGLLERVLPTFAAMVRVVVKEALEEHLSSMAQGQFTQIHTSVNSVPQARICPICKEKELRPAQKYCSPLCRKKAQLMGVNTPRSEYEKRGSK